MKTHDIRTVSLSNNLHRELEVASYIYRSKDYSIFTNFRSQRTPDHVGRIITNIIDKGYIENPILVTPSRTDVDKYVIIDGNNRFNALKELDLPISFTILENATEDDMVALNLVSKNWSAINFIRFYATAGLEHYKTFLSFLEEYPDYSVNTMKYVLQLSSTSDWSEERNGVARKLEKGSFIIKDTIKSREILDFCEQVKEIEIADPIYNQQNFVLCIMRLFRLEGFDPDTLLLKMRNNKQLLGRCISVLQYAEMLENIYNIRRRGDVFHFDI